MRDREETLQPSDWAALRVFLEVAREGGLSRAASTLHVSQSTVTRQLQHLERRLGVELAHRGAGALRLTTSGEDLAAVLLQVEDMLPTRSGPVPVPAHRLGLFGINHTELVGILGSDAAGSVTSVAVADAYRLIAAGELDLFAGLLCPVRRLPARPDVHVQELLRLPLWLAVGADSPLAGRPRLRLAELGGQRWVVHGEPDLAATFAAACAEAGVRPAVALRTDDMRELMRALVDGAVTPAVPWGREENGVVVRPCDGLGSVRVVVLRGDAHEVPARALARACRRWIRRRAAESERFGRWLADHPGAWTGAGVDRPW